MKEKIQELRKILPIPIGEAMQLLRMNDGDVELCIKLFKEKSISDICSLTGCDPKMAAKHYQDQEYDINRAISEVRETMYDLNYKPIEGLTKENLRTVLQWVYIIEDKDFATSLGFAAINKVIETLRLLPPFETTSQLIEKAKAAIDIIFDGYSDDMPIEDFVRRHRQLDDEIDFQDANNIVPIKTTVIKDELLRHIRNL